MPPTNATLPAALSPQEQILGLLIGVVQGRCVVAAAELGIADVLAGSPLLVDDIATQTNADADSLFRLMRALETLGFFKQVSPRMFENTPASECLRRDVPGSMWAFTSLAGPGFGMWEGWGELLPTLRTGRTTLFETWGYDIWEHYRRNPQQWEVFNEGMRSMTAPMTPAVTAAFDWSRFPVIADIGGGIGAQLVDILNANPNCRGVLFDQREVLDQAIPHDRVERVSGNFFEQIVLEADAYLFRNIIHDWDNRNAASILKAVRAAVQPAARVMLVEWVVPETSEPSFGKWTDITMMTALSGRERTRSEFAKLFQETGFELEEIVPTASMFSIVVGRPIAA